MDSSDLTVWLSGLSVCVQRVKDEKSFEIVLMSVVSQVFKIISDLKIIQCAVALGV